jgi:hypothetical protein
MRFNWDLGVMRGRLSDFVGDKDVANLVLLRVLFVRPQ